MDHDIDLTSYHSAQDNNKFDKHTQVHSSLFIEKMSTLHSLMQENMKKKPSMIWSQKDW